MPSAAKRPRRIPRLVPSELRRAAAPPSRTLSRVRLRIDKLGEHGVGIGHLTEGAGRGKAVMVPLSAPGDLAEVQILRETSSYARGRIDTIVEASPDRVAAPCPYYGSCGGCSLQHIRYERQLEHKRTLLAEVFRDWSRRAPVEPVLASPRELGYRNKLQMQVDARGNRLVAGFYRVLSHDIVEVDSCLLQSAAANELARDVVRTLGRHGVRAATRAGGGELRDIVIRESAATGEILLTLVTSRPRLRGEDAISRELFRRHPALRGFYLFHNPHRTEYVFKDGEHASLGSRDSPLRRIHGGTIRERLGGVELETSPLTFFQVNPGQAENVIARISRELGEARRERLVDAYCGVGALSLPLASRFREVVAIESARQSCELAKENARRAGVRSYHVRHGDVGAELERLFAESPAPPGDTLIVDPPRAGLTPAVTRAIARAAFPLVFYLSCDPRTQVRDLQELERRGGYRVRTIAPFDMFPQTFHTECLAVLEKERA